MRRPRIKVAANLSIRRPTKVATSGGEYKPVESTAPKHLDREDQQVMKSETITGDGEKTSTYTVEIEKQPASLKAVSTPSPVAEKSAFKFPSRKIS